MGLGQPAACTVFVNCFQLFNLLPAFCSVQARMRLRVTSRPTVAMVLWFPRDISEDRGGLAVLKIKSLSLILRGEQMLTPKAWHLGLSLSITEAANEMELKLPHVGEIARESSRRCILLS